MATKNAKPTTPEPAPSSVADDAPDEARRSPVRRAVGGMVMRNGQVAESLVWTNIGKGMCVWLLYYHAPIIISHEWALAVLILALIAPDLLKKVIEMRTGSSEVRTTSYERHSEERLPPVPRPEERK